MSATNRTLVHRYLELYITGNLALADEILTPHWVVHDPASPGRASGRAGEKQFANVLRTAFPDLQFTPDETLLVEGDKVVLRWTMSGTHRGAFGEIAPTGQRIAVTRMSLFRIVDGQLAEH